MLMILAGGCGTKLVDPCAHESGTCLALQIDASPTVMRLSSAQVRVSGDTIAVDQTVGLQTNASSTDLPVAVAITFPGLMNATSVLVDVVGLLNGSAVGEGELSATVTPGQHTTIHLRLDRAVVQGDGGGSGEDMASTDLAGYLPLTVQLAGSGTGTVTGSGISCSGATCSGLYPPGTMVTLAASPASNATFSGWSGAGCVGTSTCAVTLDAATTVTATFDWQFVPSHVPATTYKTDASNLTGVTSIDTHDLTINGAAPPTGVTFAFQSGVAVMSVGTWTISSPITVTGDAPLVVVAAGAVTISSTIAADAQGATPGPGETRSAARSEPVFRRVGRPVAAVAASSAGDRAQGNSPRAQLTGPRSVTFAAAQPAEPARA